MLLGIGINIIAVSSIAAILAGFIQRVSGFAFGIVFLSILPYILPYGEAVVVSKMVLLILSISTALIYRKDVDWSIARVIIFSLCLFDTIGILFLTKLDLSNFKTYLGLFFVFLGCYSLFFKKTFSFKATKKRSFMIGSITGFFSGIFGVGGPFLALYLSNINLDKNIYYATMQCSVFFVMVFDVFMRVTQGFVTLQVIKITAITLPCAFIGTILGTFMFRKMDGRLINKIINIIIIINGLNMFLR